MVEEALEHQHLHAGNLTCYYLVNLLAGFASGKGTPSPDRPLGVELLHALAGAGPLRPSQLKNVGDRSLFISGFFSDSLKRSPTDVDYYIGLGAYAYGVLSEEADSTLAPVFGELGEKFVAFVDVLGEISTHATVMSNNDLLRLYEKWLRTGSKRDGNLLVERGIVPNASIGKKFVQ